MITLTGTQFASLASGYGDADAVAVLARHEFELRTLPLLRALTDAIADSGLEPIVTTGFSTGWALLEEVEARDPRAVSGSEGVLRNPFVSAWAMRCLRELRRRRHGDVSIADVMAHLDHLAAIAVAAAARVGHDARVEVSVVEGAIAFPGLGHLVVEAPDSIRVPVRVEDGRISAEGAGRWEPTRRLCSAPTVVALEDTDPYRDTFRLPVTGRLSDGDAHAWQRQFGDALDVIRRDHGAYLPGIVTALRAVTPLRRPPSGNDIAATSRDAFGAIGSVRATAASKAALLLIHEFQHNKFNALHELVSLHDESDAGQYYAPWRPDPRPLPAFLNGTYAHVGVADFWRCHRHSPGADREMADTQFARWRQQTYQAIETLSGSAGLTAAGRRLVEGLERTVAPWLTEPVPRSAIAAAERIASDHRDAVRTDSRS